MIVYSDNKRLFFYLREVKVFLNPYIFFRKIKSIIYVFKKKIKSILYKSQSRFQKLLEAYNC